MNEFWHGLLDYLYIKLGADTVGQRVLKNEARALHGCSIES